MMWGLFAVMALTVVAILLWPLLRAEPATADRADYDLAVFRDQLAEVDREVARGVLTAEESEAARIEIKRRMLAVSKRETTARVQAPRATALLTAGVALAPFVALGLYLLVGMPQLPGQEQAFQTPEEREMAQLIDQLAARMRAQPDDPEGWALLARSYAEMKRFAEAATAYRNLIRLQPQNAEGYAAFGHATIAAAGGVVTAEARDALIQALRIDRTEPRAQFYLGLERAQAGDNTTAIAIWRALTASATPEATWLPGVRSQMAQLAQSINLMPTTVEPRHALDVFGVQPLSASAPALSVGAPAQSAGPPTQGAAAENEMIQGMVGGLAAKLAAEPNNYDGWMMLGRSYTVLQNLDGAKVAYAQAVKLKPREADPKAQLVQLILQDQTAAPSAELVRVAADIRKADGKEPLALFILGTDRARAGDAAGARDLWQSAAAGLAKDAPLHGEITRRLAALK